MRKSIQANTTSSSLFKIPFRIILLFKTWFLSNMLYTFSISPVHATCPGHLIILAFCTFTSHKAYKSSSLCSILQPSVTSSLLAPPNLLNTCSQTYSMLSSYCDRPGIRATQKRHITVLHKLMLSIPVTIQSKTWVLMPHNCRDFMFKFRPGHGCPSLVSVVCYKVKVSALGSSLIQRSPTKCAVSKCDREALIMRRPWPTSSCCAMEKNNAYIVWQQMQKYKILNWMVTHIPET